MFVSLLCLAELFTASFSEPAAMGGLSVLAVGDSLTAGFGVAESGRYTFQPYTRRLSQLCGECKVVNIGVSGMLANDMKPRMESLYEDANLVIILAGTNDLIRQVSGAEIGTRVEGLHEAAKRLMRGRGVRDPKTIAVTIPNTHSSSLYDEWIAANTAIRRYVSQSGGSTYLLDMEGMWPLPSPEGAQERMEDYWAEDKLHFSHRGYDSMGFKLYEIIKYHLSEITSHQ